MVIHYYFILDSEFFQITSISYITNYSAPHNLFPLKVLKHN